MDYKGSSERTPLIRDAKLPSAAVDIDWTSEDDFGPSTHKPASARLVRRRRLVKPSSRVQALSHLALSGDDSDRHRAQGSAAKGPSLSINSIHDDAFPALPTRLGRVSCYCIAEQFDKEGLAAHLDERRVARALELPNGMEIVEWDFEVLYIPFWMNRTISLSAGVPQRSVWPREVLYFNYGAVVMWNLTEQEEEYVLKDLEPFEINSLSDSERELDEFRVRCSPQSIPHLENDTVVLSATDSFRDKIAFSHALAQSTKLSVIEESVNRTADDTRSIPMTLARTGRVEMTHKRISQTIGRILVSKTAVNALPDVLDKPEYFWSRDDHESQVYDATYNYMEMKNRLLCLNTKITTITDVLEVLKEQRNVESSEKLEVTVILLIVVELVVGVAGCIIDYYRT